ncbi:MAG: hypothetical protein IJQ81_02765 [Oscillibacter sp.]|nr:hypothetical protein [Oscillibacter sp.]
MGKYDHEVLEKLLQAKATDICTLDVLILNITRAYRDMRAKVVVSLNTEDVLERLLAIRKEPQTEKQKLLLDRYIDDLRNCRYNEDEIISFLDIIVSSSLTVARILFDIEPPDIIDKAWKLYQEKNSFYGDIWYNRKETGLCIDMGRKIVRLEGLANGVLAPSAVETTIDTILDMINYCILMKVYLESIKEEK